mgnify:CR=1 FL=1
MRAWRLSVMLFGLIFPTAAWAERVALVIGNASYEVGELTNPRNDAADVAKALEGLGFTVIRGDDLNRSALFRKVQEFRAALRPGGIGVFFYSGHGIEVGGRNFLLPVDNGRIQTAEDVPVEAFDAQNLIDQMEGSGTRLNVVILDACRDNPLPSRWKSAGTKGLRAMEAEQGTLIAYATRAGAVAADGQGRNSPYTEVLLRHLSAPVPVTTLFNRVGLEVVKTTGSQQVPWVSTSPVPELSLAVEEARRIEVEPLAPPSTPPPVAAPQAQINPSTAPGTVFRDRLSTGGEGPAMVVLPAGSFVMGSPADEVGRGPNEASSRLVRLRGFAVGQREVTRGEFATFVASTGYQTDAERDSGGWRGCYTYPAGPAGDRFGWKAGTSWRDPGFPQDDRHPVVCVSWDDAKAYVRWLTEQTGSVYRLPSESEQEYAIRAQSSLSWAWGSEGRLGCAYANGADASGKARFDSWHWATDCADGYVFTSPSGARLANAFGLHDTVGNVWEWSEDCWAHGDSTPEDGQAQKAGDCDSHVIRGGSWVDAPGTLRSAARAMSPSHWRGSHRGFRLARTL